MGPQGVEFGNPFGFLRPTWNHRANTWELGGLANFRAVRTRSASGAIAEKYELPFPLLCDPDKKMMGSYGAFGKKLVRGEKKLGVIRSTVWIGPDGTIRKHWKQVSKAEAHPEQVLAALKEG